jgi:hypothetical protein
MHRNLRKVVGTLALTAVAVVGVAACGSSDNGSNSNGTSASAETAGGTGGAANSDLCTYAKQLEETTNPDSFSNMDKATFDKIDEIITNVQAKAPDEIKDDVATVAKNFQDVRAIFAQYDFDIAKLTSAATADSSLTEKLQSLNSDEFNAASQRVNTYLQEKCGIQGGS